MHPRAHGLFVWDSQGANVRFHVHDVQVGTKLPDHCEVLGGSVTLQGNNPN